MFCYKTPSAQEEEKKAIKDPPEFPGTIISFISFMGLNIQTGKIKWYSNPTTFQNILVKMYFGNPATKFFPVNLDSTLTNLEPGKITAVAKVINDAITEKKK